MNEYGPIAVISVEGIVVFPETELLIYVTDEQTINLIKESSASGSPIGVFSSEALSGVNSTGKLGVGCMAHPHIESTSTNGSVFVWLRMTEKIMLTRVIQEVPYALYNYSITPDIQDVVSKTFNGHVIRDLKERLLQWSQENIEDSIERSYFLAKLTGLRSITNYACMYLVESVELKQQLLENRSLYNRVHLINVLMEKHNGHEEIVKQAMIDFVTIEQTCALPN